MLAKDENCKLFSAEIAGNIFSCRNAIRISPGRILSQKGPDDNDKIAKELAEMADFGNAQTREIEIKLGDFVYENVDDEDLNLVTRGPYELSNGAVYKGQWKDNKRWGRGIQIWPEGSKYIGNWS